MNNKQKYIQLIHIAKQQLNMDEYSYRSMLERLTAKNSTTKMTLVELSKVLHELEQKGFKVRSKKGYSPKTKSAVVKSNITNKIRAVWIAMGQDNVIEDSSERALNAYMHKIINKNRNILMLNVQSLEQYEAGRLLEILKNWHKRVLIERIESKTGEKMPRKIDYDNVIECYQELF